MKKEIISELREWMKDNNDIFDTIAFEDRFEAKIKEIETRPESGLNLTMYELHMLLDELAERLRIANRDTRNAKFLYEKIATQMNGHPVTVTLTKA